MVSTRLVAEMCDGDVLNKDSSVGRYSVFYSNHLTSLCIYVFLLVRSNSSLLHFNRTPTLSLFVYQQNGRLITTIDSILNHQCSQQHRSFTT